MLPIKRRVKRESFKKILEEGLFVSGNSFYLKLLRQKNQASSSLFGIIIPNKVEKTSVGRHLMKRRISATVENLLSAMNSGFSCLIFAKRSLSSFKIINEELTELFKKAQLLNISDF